MSPEGSLLGVLEVGTNAIGSVDTFQGQITAALAWIVAITFDLTSLTLVTCDTDVSIPLGSSLRSLRGVIVIVIAILALSLIALLGLGY